ncbi:MAG: oxalate:formate antiporter, partial [Chloroflexi bacterium]|nr:oxalate:formate antiporter [Chloroflexota bacterium]
MYLPPPLRAFLARALPRLAQDERLLGVAVGGSWLARRLDKFSDLDLVIAVRNEHFATVMAERQTIAAKLGALLVGFTGEHVGEPRLLICLYDAPLLHVDLKFVAVDSLADRVEDPEVLWGRDGALRSTMALRPAAWPRPDLQWIEDRFWVWTHYVAVKLGRGELYEVLDSLGFLRARVLGPMLALKYGNLPRGARFLERVPSPDREALRATVALHDGLVCLAAMQATVALYQQLRAETAPL